MTKCRAQTVDALAAETPGAQQAGNVARTCRHFGISRKTFYKWRQRFEAHGGGGVADRARAPHHSLAGDAGRGGEQILYLRQHYHFGPGKIADYLKRFHGLSVACALAHRILRRHGMNRLGQSEAPAARPAVDAL